MKNLSEELKQELINDYITSEMSILDLCHKYKIKLNEFYIIKGQEEFKRKVKLKREKEDTAHFEKEKKEPTKIKQTRKKRKKCEDDFFEFLDIEESIYWFGFIEIGANLTDTKVQIKLSPEDFSHFEKFKTSIESDHAVTILHDGKGILNIARPRMIQDINSHITEEKYTKIMLPKTIPENMLNHFIRGLFDAKGEFDIDENGTVYFSLILPNKRLAEDCQKILMKYCNLDKTPIMNNKQRTRFTINYCGEEAKRIMEYLYTDATVYLDRKYEKFQQLRTNMN